MSSPESPLFTQILLGQMTPDTALTHIMYELHTTPEPDNDLALEVGTGPLETLLQEHEEALWPRVEQLARDDVRFRRALSRVWAYDSPMFERRSALLEELGEFRTTWVRFVVTRDGFGKGEELSWRAAEVEGSVDDDRLATLLRSVADWLEREHPHDGTRRSERD
jgi:hypothetical protein